MRTSWRAQAPLVRQETYSAAQLRVSGKEARMSAPLIRVLVVDDSPFMRGVLPPKIESDPRFKVVGTAVDGRDAIAKAVHLAPDVVTLDIDMPEMNGIDALKEIVRRTSASVIMLSARTEQGAAI